MIRAPYVDQRVGTLGLLEMIGHVSPEIGPAAVRFADRSILIVAELRRAEQRQRDWFPVRVDFALGRF